MQSQLEIGSWTTAVPEAELPGDESRETTCPSLYFSSMPGRDGNDLTADDSHKGGRGWL